MAGSDPPSKRALATLHYLQDRAHYGRSYPHTTSDTVRLIAYFLRRSLGWSVVWPVDLREGFAGGTQLPGPGGAMSGVSTISKFGDPQLSGDVTLSGGSGITLAEVGQNIAIANSLPGSLGGCSVFRTAATAGIVNLTITPIIFDNEEFDDSGYHDNATNPTRLTAPATGVYSVTGAVNWDANATGPRGLWITVNNVDSPTARRGGEFRAGATGNDMQNVASILPLAAGDFVELMAFQASGANRTITATIARPRFSIYRLA